MSKKDNNIKKNIIKKEEKKDEIKENESDEENNINEIKDDNDKEENIRNSEMMQDLKNELSDKPINYDNNSNSYLNKYMKEVEQYEKDHFVNITVPKKVIKQLKRKDNNVDDLYKLDSNLKIISNTLNDNFDKKNKPNKPI